MTHAERIEADLVNLPDDERGIAEPFYATLFDRHPEVKPLFHRNAPEKQQKMLNDAVGLVVANASDLGAIDDALRGLGTQHRDYGDIAPAHYDAVVACLVDTLRELAPDRWSPELESAWRALLDGASRRMQAGHFGD